MAEHWTADQWEASRRDERLARWRKVLIELGFNERESDSIIAVTISAMRRGEHGGRRVAFGDWEREFMLRHGDRGQDGG